MCTDTSYNAVKDKPKSFVLSGTSKERKRSLGTNGDFSLANAFWNLSIRGKKGEVEKNVICIERWYSIK